MSDSLPRLWSSTVERAPAAVAVLEAASGRCWTRAALADAAGKFAGSLPPAGTKAAVAGRRVAMAVPNGAEWFKVFLGLLSAGAVPVPMDPSEPEEAQARVARATGCSHLWSAGALHPLAGSAVRPRREALVKLTSGSSGRPKALSVTHGQMAADTRQVCRSMGIGPTDSSLAAIPLGYSYGLGNLVGPLLLQGSTVICASSVLPHSIAAEALRFKPAIFPAVPTLLRALVDSAVDGRSFSSIQLVISAGSPLPPEIARAFEDKFGVRVHGFYGTSETGGIAFDRTGDATLEGRSVGTALEGVRLAPAAGGRLRVTSPAVVGRGYFSPADRAMVNDSGEVVLLGRTDRVVKIAGRRVDLAEIESALRSVPGVSDAFAHLDAGPGAVLAAAVATALPPAEIRRRVKARLASWKIPGRIVALGEFPSTVRGKTDAAQLRQLLAAPRTANSISTLSAERQISAPR